MIQRGHRPYSLLADTRQWIGNRQLAGSGDFHNLNDFDAAMPRSILIVPDTVSSESYSNKEVQMPISNQTVERCIEECLQCLRWCSQCRDESLTEDPVMMRECIRLCGECLELCRTCVALLAGSSQFAHRVCGVCAELCEACATECGKNEGGRIP